MMPDRRVVAAVAAVASALILASCSSGAQAGGGSWAAVPQIPGAAGASFASIAAGPDRFVAGGSDTAVGPARTCRRVDVDRWADLDGGYRRSCLRPASDGGGGKRTGRIRGGGGDLQYAGVR